MNFWAMVCKVLRLLGGFLGPQIYPQLAFGSLRITKSLPQQSEFRRVNGKAAGLTRFTGATFVGTAGTCWEWWQILFDQSCFEPSIEVKLSHSCKQLKESLLVCSYLYTHHFYHLFMFYRDFLGHAKFHASFALYPKLSGFDLYEGCTNRIRRLVEGKNSPMNMGFFPGNTLPKFRE